MRRTAIVILIGLAGCVDGQPPAPPIHHAPEVDFNRGVHWFPPTPFASSGEDAAAYLVSHPREHVVMMTAVRAGNYDGILVLTSMEGATP